MSQKWDRKIVLTLNARNEHDRSKFVEDLRESVAEMDEMEALRLEAELEKQRHSVAAAGVDNRDSGIAEGGQVTHFYESPVRQKKVGVEFSSTELWMKF
jgi:hypothetical protein